MSSKIDPSSFLSVVQTNKFEGRGLYLLSLDPEEGVRMFWADLRPDKMIALNQKMPSWIPLCVCDKAFFERVCTARIIPH